MTGDLGYLLVFLTLWILWIKFLFDVGHWIVQTISEKGPKPARIARSLYPASMVLFGGVAPVYLVSILL